MDNAAWQKLMTWLSPAFPIGAFAYSGGLETAISNGAVNDRQTLANWIKGNLAHGSARSDAILMRCAHAACGDETTLKELSDLAFALTPAGERVAELSTLGGAFITAANAWPQTADAKVPHPCALPVAVGATCGAHKIAPEASLTAFLTALVQSQISVAIRLVPLGQTQGLELQATLEPQIADCARAASTLGLDDLGTISYAGDIATMAHETQTTRIFRS